MYSHTQTSGEQVRKYKVATVVGCGWCGGGGLLGLALGSPSIGAVGLAAAFGFGALLLYHYRAYSRLRVSVDDEKVSVSFGRPPFDIPLTSIRSCSVTPLPLSVTAMWGRQSETAFVGSWSPFRKQSWLGVPRAFWIGGGEWVVRRAG